MTEHLTHPAPNWWNNGAPQQAGATKGDTMASQYEPRWSREEYLLVAGAAFPLIDAGEEPGKALEEAQKVLPKDRQRTHRGVRRLWNVNANAQKRVTAYLNEARRAAKKAAAKEDKAAAKSTRADGRKALGVPEERDSLSVRWTSREHILLAIAIEAMREKGLLNHGPGRTLYDAQQAALPRTRHRGIAALHAGGKRTIAEAARACEKIWTIDEADRKRIRAHFFPEPPAAPVVETPPIETPEATTVAPQAPTTEEPAISVAQHSPNFSKVASAFVLQMQSAIDGLLAAQAQHMLEAFESRLTSATRAIAATIADSLHVGLRTTVLDALADELGGPVGKPEATPASDNGAKGPEEDTNPSSVFLEPNGGAHHPGVTVTHKNRRTVTEFIDPDKLQYADEEDDGEKLRVDVVGMNGHNITEVRKAFNGHTSLRFIDVDQVGSWIPRRHSHVVMATKFVNHKAPLKCARYHIKPVYANGGAQSVINAIRQLHVAEGMTQ